MFTLRWKEYGSPLVANIKVLFSTTQIPLTWRPQELRGLEGTAVTQVHISESVHTPRTCLQVFA